MTKTALVTGASSGIGASIAQRLSQDGYQLVLLARRLERLEQVQKTLNSESHLIVCDINDHSSLSAALEQLPEQFSQIDVLVNNAGLALGLEAADKTSWNDWQTMIETNCLSLAFLTRQILPNMVQRNSGHVINMGSIAGSYPYKGGNVYGATKAFVDQFSINLRTDLHGTRIRVTNVLPGMLAETEFSNVRFHGDDQAADNVYQGLEPLLPEDIADTVSWVVAQPNRVNVNRIEIMPTCQAPGGVVAKRLQDA